MLCLAAYFDPIFVAIRITFYFVPRNTVMQTGTVKRFNKIKGYGFITLDGSDKEVFVHFSEVEMAGYKELKVGQRISFTLEHGEKGEYATKVKIID